MLGRVLPPDEWFRLEGTGLGAVWRQFDPGHTIVLVVEDSDGAIIGTWIALNVVHLEGLWIHPDHQKRGAVMRVGYKRMMEELGNRGIPDVVTHCLTDEVRAILTKLGATEVPGSAWTLSVNGG